jgi:hypothetical protein
MQSMRLKLKIMLLGKPNLPEYMLEKFKKMH